MKIPRYVERNKERVGRDAGEVGVRREAELLNEKQIGVEHIWEK
jgi:hypothetical protein